MIVKVGDTVGWSGGFGRDVVKPAVIEQMEVTKTPRDKGGVEVNQVDASLIEQNRVLFILDNGIRISPNLINIGAIIFTLTGGANTQKKIAFHWAYSDQISLLR